MLPRSIIERSDFLAFSFFLPGTSYLCWLAFVSCCWQSWRRLHGSWRLNIYSSQERLYNLFFLSQEHLIYAGEHLYPVACQAGEDFMAPKGWTFIHHRRDFIIHFCPMNILFIYICILLLAKLEKTPWLLKAANIYSPQEGLYNLSIRHRNILFMLVIICILLLVKSWEDFLALEDCQHLLSSGGTL